MSISPYKESMSTEFHLVANFPIKINLVYPTSAYNMK